MSLAAAQWPQTHKLQLNLHVVLFPWFPSLKQKIIPSFKKSVDTWHGLHFPVCTEKVQNKTCSWTDWWMFRNVYCTLWAHHMALTAYTYIFFNLKQMGQLISTCTSLQMVINMLSNSPHFTPTKTISHFYLYLIVFVKTIQEGTDRQTSEVIVSCYKKIFVNKINDLSSWLRCEQFSLFWGHHWANTCTELYSPGAY